MAECNELFVVTSLELGPIFLTNTAVRIVRERFSDRVQVIVNRHRPSTLADAMESILEKPAFGVLPNCYDDLQDAISRGKLVRANTKYQAAIRKMVERSLGPAKPVEPTPQRMGILQSLTAMFRPLLPAAKS